MPTAKTPLAGIAGTVARMVARDEWGKRHWPQLTIGKVAGGLLEKPLGQLSAFVVQGKAQWSRIYDPRQMTWADEQRYKKLRAKQRALSRQMDKLRAGAYERGAPVCIDAVVEITNKREGHQ